MSKDSEKKRICCSFCGKSQGEVKRLIAGPNVYICDECVDLCYDLVMEESDESEFVETTTGGAEFTLLTPRDQGKAGRIRHRTGKSQAQSCRSGIQPL